MHFNLVFLVVVVMVATSEWHLYLARAVVPVENGKCQYNGTEISSSESLKLEDPCEEWMCYMFPEGTAEVVKASCVPVDHRPGCSVVKGTGVFPRCCDYTVCE